MHKIKRVIDNKELRKYKEYLDSDWSQVSEDAKALLSNHQKCLYWCTCGETSLSIKQKKAFPHKASCELECSEPSIYIHLLLAVQKKHPDVIQLIYHQTTQCTEDRWALSLDEYCDILEMVIDANHKEVTLFFGWQWLMAIEYRSLIKDRHKDAYADYVYKLFEIILASEDEYPCLNITMLNELLPIILPRISSKDRAAWDVLMPAINTKNLFFLMNDNNLSMLRKELVTEHGILWKIESRTLVQNNIAIFQSLVRYVLSTFIGYYRDDHRRWFCQIGRNPLLKRYLNDRVIQLLEQLKVQNYSLSENKQKRLSLHYFVPTPAAKLSLTKVASFFWMHWSCCPYRPTQKVPLLSDFDEEYTF